ncbi:MAG: NADPH-dependent FMN reductase [Solibacillus sp.]
MTKAIIINGGHTKFSRLTGMEQAIEQALAKAGATVETLAVHELPATDVLTANFKSVAIQQAVVKVGEADIVVLLTPIFKGAYSGILKAFLDLLPQKGLQNKTVIPAAIGGSIAHLLALQYALVPVASILGATSITQPIYIVDTQVEKLEAGGYQLDAEATERIEQVVFQAVPVNA